MTNSLYHSILRIAVAVCALVLIFDSGLWSGVTAKLADNTTAYLANAVGVSVGVAPNEFNQITAALTAREQALTERELALAEREIDIGLRTADGAVATDSSTFILATILFILLVLIVLNYTLDYIRQRERTVVMTQTN